MNIKKNFILQNHVQPRYGVWLPDYCCCSLLSHHPTLTVCSLLQVSRAYSHVWLWCVQTLSRRWLFAFVSSFTLVTRQSWKKKSLGNKSMLFRSVQFLMSVAVILCHCYQCYWCWQLELSIIVHRYFLYLQLCRDLHHGRLLCSHMKANQLAAFIVQSMCTLLYSSVLLMLLWVYSLYTHWLLYTRLLQMVSVSRQYKPVLATTS